MISTSAQETRDLGARLFRQIRAAGPRDSAVVLGLTGALGAGKTTLVQGLAHEAGVREKITSPTYVISRRYEVPNSGYETGNVFKNIYHVDAYRLESPAELLRLGWREMVEEPTNLVLVEWADRIRSVLPVDVRLLEFRHRGLGKRAVTISPA